MAKLHYDGLRDSGTFRVDAETKAKIAKDPLGMKGKVVAFTVAEAQTGDPQVGFGKPNDAIAGVVVSVEQDETASDEFVATIGWHCTYENIATANSVTTAKEGVGVACDGKGGVVTKPEMTNAFCLALNDGKTSCLIRVL